MGYEKSAEYYDLFGEKSDTDYYTTLAVPYGSALEIGVGTARVALELAKAGCEVWGIDNSEEMLKIARKKVLQLPEKVQEKIVLRHQDMTDFHLERKFPFIYVPSSGFSHCITTEDQLNCLNCVHDHLAEDGLFVFDLILPGRSYSGALTLIGKRKVGDEMILRWISHNPDYVNQRLYTTLIFEVYKNENLQKRIVESSTVSLIYKRELLLLLDKAHFDVIHQWGDFSRADTITDLLVVEAAKSKL